MGLKNNPHEREDTIFATILSDGKIHVAVSEDTEGAVKREYETSDGKTGEKWEHVYTELSGMITKIDFREGDYGINLTVVVGDEDEEEKPVTLALSTESSFGEDLMKKLPNVDLKKPVKLEPFSFENDKNKKVRGVTVTQEGKKGEKEKILNFFWDADKKVPANGYPKPPVAKGKPLTKSQWRKYFSEAREFLIEDLTERFHIAGEESETDKSYNDM